TVGTAPADWVLRLREVAATRARLARVQHKTQGELRVTPGAGRASPDPRAAKEPGGPRAAARAVPTPAAPAKPARETPRALRPGADRRRTPALTVRAARETAVRRAPAARAEAPTPASPARRRPTATT